jgi:hypothetical protein
MQFLSYDPYYNPDSPAAQVPPSAELMEQMDRLISEALQAGVLVTTGTLQRTGTRVRLKDGKFTVTDGPFIELKELLGGWAVMNVKDLDEAIAWTKRFLTIVGGGESEIVRIDGPDDNYGHG